MVRMLKELKTERAGFKDSFYELGKKTGYEYADNLDYPGFLHALSWRTARECKQANGNGNYNFREDEVFGNLFARVMDDNVSMRWEETDNGKSVPNENFCEWEQGFVDGIKEVLTLTLAG